MCTTLLATLQGQAKDEHDCEGQKVSMTVKGFRSEAGLTSVVSGPVLPLALGGHVTQLNAAIGTVLKGL